MKTTYSLCAVWACCVAAAGATLHVSPSGSDENAGTADAPFATVQAAVDAAEAGDTVLLAPGAYPLSSTLSIQKGVAVEGQDWLTTTLRPSAAGFRAVLINHADAALRGVAVSGAVSPQGGAGVYIGSAGGSLEDSLVTGCSVSASVNGAGVYVAGRLGAVRRCRILENTGLLNSASYGGGIYVDAGGTIESCLIVGNKAQWGGGLYVNNGATRIVHCTVAGNLSTSRANDCYYYKGTPAVTNCIIGSINSPVSGAPYYSHCAVSLAGDANIAYSSALFADSQGLDRLLAEGSAAAAAGVAVDGGAVRDVDGSPFGGPPAIGCHASAAGGALHASFATSANGVLTGESITLTPLVAGASGTASCTWTLVMPDGTVEGRSGAADAPVSFTATVSGEHAVRLRVVDGTDSASCALLPAFIAGVATNYVSASGSNIPPYDTWEKAANEISDALAVTIPGATVLVAGGTYEIARPIEVSSAISLVGAGGRDAVSVVPAAGVDTRLLHVNHPDAVVRGFTFSGGRIPAAGHGGTPNYGGSVLIDTNGGTVEDCAIVNSSDTAGARHGIGLAILGTGTARRCVIADNVSVNGGAWGGGAYLRGGVLDTCLVYGNSAAYGGGVYAENTGHTVLVGCTVVDNNSTTGANQGRDLYNYNVPSAFTNCLVGYVNTRGAITTACNLTLESNALGTKVADFLFTAAGSRDYTLQATSPAVDAGLAVEGQSARDVFGLPRPQGAAIDIGSLERTEGVFTCNFSCDGTTFWAGEAATFTPSFADNVGEPSCTWTVVDHLGTTSTYATTGAAPLALRLQTAGPYAVTLRAATATQEFSVTHDDVVRAGVANLYVAEAAAAEFPFDSPAKAAASLHDVLPLAIGGSTIQVGPGDFALTNELTISDALTLLGAGRDLTTLRLSPDAPPSRVVEIDNQMARVSGFTITGGRPIYPGNGAGVNIAFGGGVLADCRVTGNAVVGRSNPGGGVAVNSRHGLVTRCIVDGNSAGLPSNDSQGGGIYLSAGHADNCLVYGNSAYYGGGLYMNGGSCTATNCTVVANNATYRGGGIYLWTVNSPCVVNSLFHGNTAPAVTTDNDDNRWVYNAVFVQNGALTLESSPVFVNCLSEIDFPTGLAAIADPLFADPETDDYRPQRRSRVRDAGLAAPWMAGATDLDGRPRLAGASVDVGCYELDRISMPTILSAR